MNKVYGIDYLRAKLTGKASRVHTRYQFYEMKNAVPDFHISTPPQLQRVMASVGWCAKGVDAMADRLDFHSFQNDPFDLDSIFNDSCCRDILFDDAILSACIGSCSFIYIFKNENDEVQMQVIDGANATGILDPITRLLTEGYAILETDDMHRPTLEAYFTTEATEYYRNGELESVVDNPTGYCLLVPVVLKPDAKRPFGHSRITRDCMYYQCAAARTMKRSEISGEFYSFPQKYVTGMPEDFDADGLNKWKAAMSAMMIFYADENGNRPQPGQFQQQSMSPYMDQLEMFASAFAGSVGITLDDLGFSRANPQSEGAVKANHEELQRMCIKASKNFAVGFKNAGFVAACLNEGKHIKRKELGTVRTIWRPLFIPDASSLASIGDGVIKINDVQEGYIDDDVLFQLTGIEKEVD